MKVRGNCSYNQGRTVLKLRPGKINFLRKYSKISKKFAPLQRQICAPSEVVPGADVTSAPLRYGPEYTLAAALLDANL